MSAPRVVVADSNVLINLIHVDSLALLDRINGLEFIVLEDVIGEITQPEQTRALDYALSAGWLRSGRLETPEGLDLFSTLARSLGRGEAASLAMAVSCGYAIACDEKRGFRREAIERLGKGSILTTPGILLLAIRQGLITVEEADRMKLILERKRFAMTFASFKELV